MLEARAALGAKLLAQLGPDDVGLALPVGDGARDTPRRHDLAGAIVENPHDGRPVGAHVLDRGHGEQAQDGVLRVGLDDQARELEKNADRLALHRCEYSKGGGLGQARRGALRRRLERS